jgi:hypothetical protein
MFDSGMLHRGSWLASALFALAAGLVANTVLGPLITGTIQYRYSESLINQGIAVDAVALVAAAIAVAAAVLVRRGHRAGPVLAFIPATFTAYMAPQYVIGPDYSGLPGNNEQYFLLHLGLFVLGMGLILAAWAAVDRDLLVPRGRASDRRRIWVMLGVAGFIALGRWLPAVIDLMSGQSANPDFLENATANLLIGILDLGLVVPAALAAAVGLGRGARWAGTAAYAVIGWFALVPASVAAMSVTMQVNEDPNADMGSMILFIVAALVFTAGAFLLYRPLFAADRSEFPRGIDDVTGSEVLDVHI